MAFQLGKTLHLIHIVDDYEEAAAWYADVFNGLADWIKFDGFPYLDVEIRDADLIIIGDCCVEPMAPAKRVEGWDEKPVGRFLNKFGQRWQTIEEPFALVEALRREARADRPILVDCLTLWLSNLLLAERDVAREGAALVDALPSLRGPVLFIANEVGLGIVPDNALARAFRDHAGVLNQAIAAKADRVVFMAAGLPLLLKDKG